MGFGPGGQTYGELTVHHIYSVVQRTHPVMLVELNYAAFDCGEINVSITTPLRPMTVALFLRAADSCSGRHVVQQTGGETPRLPVTLR